MKHSTLFMSAALALTLAACTSNNATAPTPSQAASADATATAEPSETEESTEMAEPGAPKYEMIGNYMSIPKGEPFEWDTTMFGIEDAGIMRVTLQNAECGLDEIPADLMPEGDGPAKPEAGNKFCLFAVSVENIGDTPVTYYGYTGDVLADGKQYAAAPADDDINYSMELAAEPPRLNPGATAVVRNAIQVPEGITVDHVLFPKPTGYTDSVVAFATR